MTVQQITRKLSGGCLFERAGGSEVYLYEKQADYHVWRPTAEARFPEEQIVGVGLVSFLSGVVKDGVKI